MAAKIVACKVCGKEVSQTAKVCPHCGKKCPAPMPTGCFVIILILAIIVALILFSDDSPTTEKKQINISEQVELNKKLSAVLGRVGIHADQLNSHKITYDVTMYEDDILSLSEDEIKILLPAILYKAPNNNCCDRAFVSIYHPWSNSIFASLHWEKGKINTITAMWDQTKCGLEKYLENRAKFDEKVRWLRSNVSNLAIDFINAYHAGEDLAEYRKQSIELSSKWSSILSALMDPNPDFCYKIFFRPHSQAKENAIGILSMIEDSNNFVNIKAIEDNFDTMEAYRL